MSLGVFCILIPVILNVVVLIASEKYIVSTPLFISKLYESSSGGVTSGITLDA